MILVLADARGWRKLSVPAMSMIVFTHEEFMEFSRESLEFIAQAKRGTHHDRERNEPNRTLEGEHKILKLFVYGTLKRGFWNHDRFCRGVLDIQEAVVRGRLYEMHSGIPVLQVPDEDVLGHDTSDTLADVATQACLSEQTVIPRTGSEKRHTGRLGHRVRGASHL